MEKFAVDLDKVLDEFEFNEDRAEQMATILAKRNNSSISPIMGSHLLHQPPSTCFRRPAFEPINLADADFAADLQISAPCYNNGFSSVTDSSPGPPPDDPNVYLTQAENINITNDLKTKNDSQNSDLNWQQNMSSAYNNSRVDVSTFDQRSLPQNSNYTENMQNQGNLAHTSHNSDYLWQQDVIHDRLEASNKLNVSGVFSSLNEYLSAGNIEAKLNDPNIVKNQTSWNQSSHRLELEENGNYDFSHSGTPAGNQMSNLDHQSSSLCHSINCELKNETQKLGGESISNIFQKDNLHEVKFSGNDWSNTIDVCKVSENSSQNSYADLIPISYARSHQEESSVSGQKASCDLTSSDETPDLLDTSVISSRGTNSNPTRSQNQSIMHSVEDNSREQGVMCSSEVDQNYPSKDHNQTNLTLLPDVASSGRNMLQVPRTDASVTSDLVTSHGVIKCSDDENVLDLISHGSDISDGVMRIFSEEDKPASARLPKSTECQASVNNTQKTHGVDDTIVSENVTSHSQDASISKADSKLHETCSESNEDKIPHKIAPVGFSALEELNDAELHQYLQELEDNDLNSENGQDGSEENKLNAGGNLLLIEQKQIVSISEADCGGEDLSTTDHIRKEHEVRCETSDSFPEVKNKVSEVDSGEKSHFQSINDSDANLAFNETSDFQNDRVVNNHNNTSRISIEEDLIDTSSVPHFSLGSNPRIAPMTSVNCRSVNNVDEYIERKVQEVETQPNIPATNKHITTDVSAASIPHVSVASKTSAITNLVTIDCHQINKSSNGSSDQNHLEIQSCKEEGRRNETEEYINHQTKDTQNETCDLVISETKSLDSIRSVSGSEKTENGLTSKESSSILNNLSSSQETNFDSAENGFSTPEIYMSSNETSSCDKSPHEILPDYDKAVSQTEIKTVLPDMKNESSYDTLKTATKNVTEIEYSEVQSCLVRMPKDGSTINVLGEEERPSRPKYLFLPSKITVENEQNDSENSEDSPPKSGVIGPPGETPTADMRVGCTEAEDSIPLSSPDISESSSIEQALSPVTSLQIATPLSDDLSDILSPEERSLGKLPPFWVPDADAPNCMLCDVKFTVLKRRHHCRACGKVLCSKCCSLKSRLEYMDNSEARVCQPCYTILAKIFLVEQGESASGSPSSLNEGVTNGNNAPLGRQPNPNNPMEYCSTIPPLEQAASVLRQPPPSVLVPVGVLKREGSTRSRSDVAKQVIFSDGIRPGGDLTELDGSSEPRLPYRRPGRVLKRVGTPPGPPSASNHSSQRLLPPLDPKTLSYIPADKGLPPLAVITKGEIKFEEVVDHEKQMAALRSETEPPAMFAINRNLFVHIKILNLDCCVNRTCWCFTTSGMSCVGQDEIMIILECLPDEASIPKDVFRHLNTIYQDASRGNTISELGHTVFQGVPFLDSSEHGGFIYIRPSFQCLQKLMMPTSPYLVAILVHRWETPWATVFPIRLMLRLGAEYRYYPCMLVSIRNRRPVYWEIGHTIINLLADFRNLSYTLPSVRGLVIHMEDRQTSILLPKNRYDQVIRALNNSNDHVLALASNFSFHADSHLVCIQSNRDESYHTQAINIHNKPRKVTGASFVVFNGALKASSNLTAKSSIVEDGLMVQITPDTMQALRTALRNMQDFCVGCGPAGASQPDELVNLKWVQDDKNFNVGVKSSIDGLPLDGIPSIRVHNGTDYMGSCRFIRWTEVFILQSDEGSGRRGDPLDISRLSESLARATCLALIKLLDLLAQAGLTKLAVRATVHPENVGYEAGSKGDKLPPIYMDSLDNELVPVLHKAASMSQDSSAAILELIFHVMLQ